MKTRSLATIAIAMLPTLPLSAREPTELEQYYLELINRARATPEAEVSRLSGFQWDGTPDLNEGLSPGTISSSAKPPLAFNPLLMDAASDHADLLLATQEFTHYLGGTTPASRMKDAGYDFTPPWGSSENLAWSGKFPENPLDANAVEEHHRELFIDRGVRDRGHRTSLMDADLREAGVAIRPDGNGISASSPGVVDLLSVQDFAYSADHLFVTGIAYTDLDKNGFFTPDSGEARGGATVEVLDDSGDVIASGTTFSSGGYSIDLSGKKSGAHVLRITDNSGKVSTVNFTYGASANVKVDAVGEDSKIDQKRKLRLRIQKLKRKLKKTGSNAKKRKYRKSIKKLKTKLKALKNP